MTPARHRLRSMPSGRSPATESGAGSGESRVACRLGAAGERTQTAL